jgi:hypothetical protein
MPSPMPKTVTSSRPLSPSSRNPSAHLTNLSRRTLRTRSRQVVGARGPGKNYLLKYLCHKRIEATCRSNSISNENTPLRRFPISDDYPSKSEYQRKDTLDNNGQYLIVL